MSQGILTIKRLMNGSSIIALAFAAFATAPAAAQDRSTGTQKTPAPTAETSEEADIIVTGYRAALRSAIREKRDATVQVDAITAEDIADFPDSNLAESLQRLPGVSIDRDNGEGRGITVRGLGGDFNRTRLNGLEALSTAGSNDAGTSPNRSRSFDYNTFASELFSSLKVQKTTSAETDEGSLGAVVDLNTGNPLNGTSGLRGALSVIGSYNDLSKDLGPRAAGLLSWLSIPAPWRMRIRRVSLLKGAGRLLGLRLSLGKIAPNWISSGSLPEP